MLKYEKVTDADLRKRLTEAHEQLRGGKPTEAVHLLAETFLEMLRVNPELATKRAANARMAMPLWMRWPRLGADLDPESVQAGDPRVEFKRERFAMSEAITYYEFTVDTAIEQGL